MAGWGIAAFPNGVVLSAKWGAALRILATSWHRKKAKLHRGDGVKFLSGVALIGIRFHHTRFRGFRCLALVVAGGFWDGNIPARGVRWWDLQLQFWVGAWPFFVGQELWERPSAWVRFPGDLHWPTFQVCRIHPWESNCNGFVTSSWLLRSHLATLWSMWPLWFSLPVAM